MIDNTFRAVLPRFAGPTLKLYARLGLSPDQVSFIGFSIGALAAVAVALEHPGLAIALWWLGRLADGTDGVYARTAHRATDFGAYLDIVLDMAAYSLMIVGFAIAHPELRLGWIVVVVFYVLCIASALALGMQEAKRALPPRDDRGLRLGAGLAEGGETGLAYTLFLLFPAALPWLVPLWIGILAVTVVARTVLARRLLRDPPAVLVADPVDGTSPAASASPIDEL